MLHAHLPWVLTHGRWPHGSEWLYEAAAASYLPLIERLLALRPATAPPQTPGPRLTVSLSPILLEQLADPAFADGFEEWLQQRSAAARNDARDFRRARDVAGLTLARHWEESFTATREQFRNRWGRSLIAAFRELGSSGRAELITTAATHGYLPLLGRDGSITAQIQLARRVFERHFGQMPRGFWLPECAYRPRAHWASPVGHPPEGAVPADPEPAALARLRPGIEEFLHDTGVRFFVVDSQVVGHGALPPPSSHANFAEPPRLSDLGVAWNDEYALPATATRPLPAAPVRNRPPRSRGSAGGAPRTPSPAAFLRDPETAIRVWNRHVGYPGDPCYLDFHRRRFPGGLRYWRVTDNRGERAGKEPYDPAAAAERVRHHAADFLGVVAERLTAHQEATGTEGVLCAPFDAELFGHWWFEGPEWLAAVLGQIEAEDRVRAATPIEYLEGRGVVVGGRLREGSWGRGGEHGVWLNDQTAWAWGLIHRAEARLAERVVNLRAHSSPVTRDLLRQMARELLLLQASDWPFLISTLGARDYAEERLRGHGAAFDRLDAIAARISAGESPTAVEREELRRLETLDRPFPEVDPEWWSA